MCQSHDQWAEFVITKSRFILLFETLNGLCQQIQFLWNIVTEEYHILQIIRKNGTLFVL